MQVRRKATDYQNLIYEITHKPEHLAQYSELLVRLYKQDLELDFTEQHMQAGVASVQANERVFIVRDGHRVIAGSKISYACRGQGIALPMEEGKFSVTPLLPDGQSVQVYGEIGRLVVDPDYRGREILLQLIDTITQYSLGIGCQFLFVLAPALNAVLYRRVCRGLSMVVRQHKEVALPDKALYRKLDIKLLSCDIRGLSQHTAFTTQSMPIAV
ncbi:MAG: hypothetical protein HUJ29_03500 [Gammaproteobacteria bacterium]|nr:hypothetical protein [Gammaproteobacteria bacterium]